MLRYLRNKRGQNTAEYAILIGVVVAGVIAMQLYVRRGMQARVKDAVDFSLTNDTSGVFRTPQYEPYYTSTDFATTHDMSTSVITAEGGGMTRELDTNVTRLGTESYTTWNITP